MKNRFLIAVGLTALLTACGGGGGGTDSPIPTANTHTVGFTLTAVTPKGVSVSRSPQSAGCPTSSPPPIVLQADAGFSPPPGSLWNSLYGNQILAVEESSQCAAIAETNVTYTAADPNVVTLGVTSFNGLKYPSPPPGATTVEGAHAGTTTIAAKFADGTTGLLTVDTYAQFGLSCSLYYLGGANTLAQPGWSAVTGPNRQVDACNSTQNVHDPVDAQIDSSGNLEFPYGYDVVLAASNSSTISQFVEITSCSAFASQGTSLNLGGYPSPLGIGFILLFKTSTGQCVKVDGQVANLNDPTVVGLYSLSDVNGHFAY